MVGGASVEDDASLASRRKGWFADASGAVAGAAAGAAVSGGPVHTCPFFGLPQTRHMYVLRFPPPAGASAAVGRLREAPPPEGSTLCDDGAVVAEAE